MSGSFGSNFLWEKDMDRIVSDSRRSRQPIPTGIEAMVCADIAARQQVGISKYGCTVAESADDMLRHAYEEALDLAVYLRAELERRRAERAALTAAWRIITSVPLSPAGNWACPFCGSVSLSKAVAAAMGLSDAEVATLVETGNVDGLGAIVCVQCQDSAEEAE